MPGGKRECGESIDNTAQRELFEETGAQSFEISPLFDYSVTRDEAEESFGRVYYAEVKELQGIPFGSEIREVGFMNDLPESLTYPAIQPILYRQAIHGIS
ncbi:NUDIX domain protein [compost metagenome]